MNIKILFLTVFCFTSFGLATAQHSIHTQPLSDEIKSIQILVNDDPFLPPIIKLQGDDRITLKFDKLSIEEPRLRYRIFHCTANWQKSDLRDIDFLNGFNNQLIEDYRFSENTTVSYIHYDLNFPNRQVSPKISGNYAIEVYYENAPEDPLLQACFSVTENQVRIQGRVSGNTDFDFNKAHQQISFEISHPRFPSTMPSVKSRLPFCKTIASILPEKTCNRLIFTPTGWFSSTIRILFLKPATSTADSRFRVAGMAAWVANGFATHIHITWPC
jgi:hypothetical protein